MPERCPSLDVLTWLSSGRFANRPYVFIYYKNTCKGETPFAPANRYFNNITGIVDIERPPSADNRTKYTPLAIPSAFHTTSCIPAEYLACKGERPFAPTERPVMT